MLESNVVGGQWRWWDVSTTLVCVAPTGGAC